MLLGESETLLKLTALGGNKDEHLEDQITTLNIHLGEPIADPKLGILRLTLRDMKLAALIGMVIYTPLFALEQTIGIPVTFQISNGL